ncbi:MAG: zinc metalloprotease HtpX [Dehalococcoidia bacterium]|nr:zinc metalloprotease HtpX [Dehalococcoidia bacterium]
MRSRVPGRDWGLTWRMYFVLGSLAVVYLAFVAILNALGVPWVFVAVIAGIILLVQFFFSDKLVLMSMRAKVKTPEEEPELHAIVDRLVSQAGMPKPKVAVAESDVPNAFATGRNPRNSVVCVTTGIVRRLTSEELEGVLGHELTHVRNRDVMVITLASFFATVAAMLMQWLFWMGLFGGMGRSRNREGGSGSYLMLAYLASVAVYFVATLLILALSRYREYAADRGGALLTGMPSRLASALGKISGAIARIPTEDLRKVETANAFFIVSALKGDSIAGLFSSHPPVHKRIERLHALERELEGF